MPRGYFLFFVAASGALVLAFFFGSILQPEQPNFAGDRGYQEQAASYRAGGAKCEPVSVRSLPATLRQSKEDACAEAKEQHRTAANGLITARRSTVAAESNAYYSFVQSRIAAWGAAVGLLTLFAAVGAAIFAERAAFHAKSGTNAYKARESAQMLPGIFPTPKAIGAIAKNVGPTRANILISKSALFEDPPGLVPFNFPGHVRAAVAVEGGHHMDFGEFEVPPGLGTIYLVGGIIYRTVFGNIEFMPAGFEIDRKDMSWTIYSDLDWDLWEQELATARRKQIK